MFVNGGHPELGWTSSHDGDIAVRRDDGRSAPPCPRCGQIGSVHVEGPTHDRVLLCSCGWQAPLPTENIQTCPLCGFEACLSGSSPGEVYCAVCWSVTQPFRVDAVLPEQLRTRGVWADPYRVRRFIQVNGPSAVIDGARLSLILPVESTRQPTAPSQRSRKRE